MKGQYFEQYFTLALFIIICSYFFLQVIIATPRYLNEHRFQILNSKAFQISEILLNDPGYPIDWENDPINVIRFGLNDQNSNKTNFIKINKAIKFNQECSSDYQNIKNKLGVSKEFDFSISLIFSNGTQLINCTMPSFKPYKMKETIKRIGYSKDGFFTLIVEVLE